MVDLERPAALRQVADDVDAPIEVGRIGRRAAWRDAVDAIGGRGGAVGATEDADRLAHRRHRQAVDATRRRRRSRPAVDAESRARRRLRQTLDADAVGRPGAPQDAQGRARRRARPTRDADTVRRIGSANGTVGEPRRRRGPTVDPLARHRIRAALDAGRLARGRQGPSVHPLSDHRGGDPVNPGSGSGRRGRVTLHSGSAGCRGPTEDADPQRRLGLAEDAVGRAGSGRGVAHHAPTAARIRATEDSVGLPRGAGVGARDRRVAGRRRLRHGLRPGSRAERCACGDRSPGRGDPALPSLLEIALQDRDRFGDLLVARRGRNVETPGFGPDGALRAIPSLRLRVERPDRPGVALSGFQTAFAGGGPAGRAGGQGDRPEAAVLGVGPLPRAELGDGQLEARGGRVGCPVKRGTARRRSALAAQPSGADGLDRAQGSGNEAGENETGGGMGRRAAIGHGSIPSGFAAAHFRAAMAPISSSRLAATPDRRVTRG